MLLTTSVLQQGPLCGFKLLAIDLATSNLKRIKRQEITKAIQALLEADFFRYLLVKMEKPQLADKLALKLLEVLQELQVPIVLETQSTNATHLAAILPNLDSLIIQLRLNSLADFRQLEWQRLFLLLEIRTSFLEISLETPSALLADPDLINFLKNWQMKIPMTFYIAAYSPDVNKLQTQLSYSRFLLKED